MTMGTLGSNSFKASILAYGAGILTRMDVRTVELFTSLLALVALIGGLSYAFVSGIASPQVSIVAEIRRLSLWLAWLVAAGATAGSLYFSEIADYVPCRLCWFQRICMYPLAGILLVAAIRKDRNVRWYALPLLIAGICLSSYHYLIEWKPSFGEGACGIGPSCTDVWFRRMGFVTLAFMALSGFIAIAALLFVQPKKSVLPEETRN
jgi:disulfide bond formation protein DsbB